MTEAHLLETVIVVQGTFDWLVDGVAKWWQRCSTICVSLDRQLAAWGAELRCWTHCSEARYARFSGDDFTNWKSRHDAAIYLNEHIMELLQAGWRFRLAAHCHGGNLMIRALHEEISVYLLKRVPADWTVIGDLFRGVVGELSLVHSAYFVAPENCAQIARFIEDRT